MIIITQEDKSQVVNDTTKFTPEIARAIAESLGYEPSHGKRVAVMSQVHKLTIELTGREGKGFRSYVRLMPSKDHANAWEEISWGKFR